jgi:ABC-2 type transport system ATP-binding protein
MKAKTIRRRAEATPASSSESVIRTEALTKRYGTLTAVDALDLEVKPGEIFGLLGQNGAGKTTTILMLLGLTEPTSGSATVMGLDPQREPRQVKRRVGYLPDAVGFYGGLTGRQNLRYTARLNGLRNAEAEAAITDVLERVGLHDRADDRVETHGRGMRQRLARRCAGQDPGSARPREPTTAIDPFGVDPAVLRSLVDEHGLAIQLSSHLLSQVQSVCDRIGIFADGRLVGEGTVPELAKAFGDGSATIEVELELAGPDEVERAGTALRGLTGVERVVPPGDAADAWQVIVRPAAAEGGVRQDILVAAVEHGLRLTSIRPIVPSLDDIYRVAVSRVAA